MLSREENEQRRTLCLGRLHPSALATRTSPRERRSESARDNSAELERGVADMNPCGVEIRGSVKSGRSRDREYLSFFRGYESRKVSTSSTSDQRRRQQNLSARGMKKPPQEWRSESAREFFEKGTASLRNQRTLWARSGCASSFSEATSLAKSQPRQLPINGGANRTAAPRKRKNPRKSGGPRLN